VLDAALLHQTSLPVAVQAGRVGGAAVHGVHSHCAMAETEGDVLVDAETGVRAVPDEVIRSVEVSAGVDVALLSLGALAVMHALVAPDARAGCDHIR